METPVCSKSTCAIVDTPVCINSTCAIASSISFCHPMWTKSPCAIASLLFYYDVNVCLASPIAPFSFHALDIMLRIKWKPSYTIVASRHKCLGSLDSEHWEPATTKHSAQALEKNTRRDHHVRLQHVSEDVRLDTKDVCLQHPMSDNPKMWIHFTSLSWQCEYVAKQQRRLYHASHNRWNITIQAACKIEVQTWKKRPNSKSNKLNVYWHCLVSGTSVDLFCVSVYCMLFVSSSSFAAYMFWFVVPSCFVDRFCLTFISYV